MDTIAHGLTGAAIGYAGFRQRGGRTALAASVAAGIFPDSDIVLRAIDAETYLQWHRGFTHSAVLLPFWCVLIAGLVWYFSGRKSFRTLWVAATAAMGAHLFMDWITSYGTLLLWPITDRRFALSWVFIIDVYVWAALLVTVVAAVRTQRAGVARWGLAVMAAYFLMCGVSQFHALRIARASADAPRVAAYAQPLNPFRWTIVTEDDSVVTWRNGDHAEKRFVQFQDPQLSPLAEATPTVKFFRWFAGFPLVEKQDQAPYTVLRYRDLRFRTPMPWGKVHEGTFVVSKVWFDQQGNILAAGLTSDLHVD